MPTRESLPDEHLRLLFRWSDLYYLAYHCADTWYVFEDELGVDLPPTEKLFFKNIVDLSYDTSYRSLGGSSIKVGPAIFRKFYTTLMESRHFEGDELDRHLFRCCMTLPVVAFAEALQFLELLQWVSIQVNLEADSVGNTVPIELSKHFNSWGTHHQRTI
ncbi:hypothetical protein QOZ80_1AG0001050 [Eleusine coracana subsp. coracana]|nr:hypothetical protein QOZ80_1AG0001050 [Eleusine coracana subsp. coracana]